MMNSKHKDGLGRSKIKFINFRECWILSHLISCEYRPSHGNSLPKIYE
jgi:hypothetical protein